MIPPKILAKADRRNNLWHKNKDTGLTVEEKAEYKRLLQAVNRYIKKKYPADWEKIKKWGRRTKFNMVP